MAFTYMFASTSFALLCSLCWLATGGSFLSALLMYLVSGQVAMLAMIAKAFVTLRAPARSR